MANVEPRNGWANLAVQFLLGALLTIAMAVIMNLSNRVGAVEADIPKVNAQQDLRIAATEKNIGEINVKLGYLESAATEQKADIKEILRAVKQ